MKAKPRKGRRNVALFLTLPPEERARLEAFAKTVDRPMSWCVRDALTVYLDAVEADADRLAALQGAVRDAALDPARAGRTVQAPRGRPSKKGKGKGKVR
jgi:predicted DNA-binding protein